MNNLYWLRKEHNLTLRQLEQNTKINFSNLAQIEKGNRCLTQKHIDILCDFFGVSSDFLLGKSDFGIYLNLSTGFITINKNDYLHYKFSNLINEFVVDNQVIRSATKELENNIDPLFNRDLIEQINQELKTLTKKQLEKVLKLINEVVR